MRVRGRSVGRKSIRLDQGAVDMSLVGFGRAALPRLIEINNLVQVHFIFRRALVWRVIGKVGDVIAHHLLQDLVGRDVVRVSRFLKDGRTADPAGFWDAVHQRG